MYSIGVHITSAQQSVELEYASSYKKSMALYTLTKCLDRANTLGQRAQHRG
jgi:hypothetical protein